jgi:hypothetical protein
MPNVKGAQKKASAGIACRLAARSDATRGGGASSFARADRSGSRRGAWGNLSSAMARRTKAVTAACSSSVRSVIGMG